MDPTNIIIIVGISLLFVERLFTCLYRVKKSKCCGGELELGTPTKNSSNLAESQEIGHENKMNLQEAINGVKEISKIVQQK